MPTGCPPFLADPLLGILAAQHTDVEKARIAFNNRLGQLTRTGPDKDGHHRGFGITEDDKLIIASRESAKFLEAAEHGAEVAMRRQLRRHALWPWAKAQIGIGEKTLARLLGMIGDPYIAPEREVRGKVRPSGPRTVSELWAYCGLHVVRAGDVDQQNVDNHPVLAGIAPRRRRGQKANWSTAAKTRLFVMAEACLKLTGEPDKNRKPTPQSPYRKIYDNGRAKYAEALHLMSCERCGPAGKPAPTGSPLSDGHKHARAMRLVMKEILRDLWIEAKRLHGTQEKP